MHHQWPRGHHQNKGPNHGARRTNYGAECTTLNKDGKQVWEPGLPAECTVRRVHKPVRKEVLDDAPVNCDPKNILRLPAGAKADWLDKALKAVPVGRAKVQDVFNIVTHPRFVGGVQERNGRRMLRRVAESLSLFSDKQRTTLVAKCKLAELFQSSTASGDDDDDEDDDEDEAPENTDDVIGDTSLGETEDRPKGGGSHSWQQRRSPSADLHAHRAAPHAERRAKKSPSPSTIARRAARSSDGPRPPAEGRTDDPRPPPPADTERRAQTEERGRVDHEYAERKRQAELEKERLESERKVYEERERTRKAKLGAAFLVPGEDDDDDEDKKAPVVVKRRDAERADELSYAFEKPVPLAQAVERSLRGMPASSVAGAHGQESFVQAMGGNSLLNDAAKILQDASITGCLGAPVRERSPSRRRRRDRSRSRGGRYDDRGRGGSYRSPTPDGKARGQARAARKAKLIASMMGVGWPRA